jgi:hypothetical protein
MSAGASSGACTTLPHDNESYRSSQQGNRMTTRPPRPPDRVRHGWQCTRNSPLMETVRADQTGRPRVVALCTECDGTDLAERLRDEAERKPT